MTLGYGDGMSRATPIPLNKDNNPGGARWCEEHQRLECVKDRSRGRGPCHEPAIRGTKLGRIHSGVKAEVAKAAGQAKITAWSALGSNADSVDYRMAVLAVLQMSWLRLAAYSELLRQQVVKEMPEPDREGFIPGEAVNSNGLIGYRYGAAGKDGHIFAQSEEVRALVVLESAERDRVVKYAKTAHDMGISDRLTSLAEKWGDVVATRITSMLDALELTPEQTERVPALLQTHLGSIDMGAMGGPSE
jgi:hypothetical protein